jgi:hypothetical protein
MFVGHVVPRAQTAKYATDYIDTCLGDLYSVGWIEFAEKHNLHSWSLQKEFEHVRNRTSHQQTYREVCLPLEDTAASSMHCSYSMIWRAECEMQFRLWSKLECVYMLKSKKLEETVVYF